MAVPAEILDATMRLPEPMRRELGRQLLESADPTADGEPRDVASEWNAEAVRRIEEFRQGTATMLTEAEVRDLLDQ
ncbi:MAG: addiction module protein [Sporichthyaceae bacterium]